MQLVGHVGARVLAEDGDKLDVDMMQQVSSQEKEEAEGSEASDAYLLPDCDILIHCGDFQIDASTRPRLEATQRFDQWLSEQPCASGLKLVVRGNHDHMGAEFPLSGAQYVVRPTVVEACGLRLGIVPFSRGRLKEPLPECDVLLTHVPPKGILDKCYNGDRGEEAPDSVRAKFGTDNQRNAAHGSDSTESAARELAMMFA